MADEERLSGEFEMDYRHRLEALRRGEERKRQSERVKKYQPATTQIANELALSLEGRPRKCRRAGEDSNR